MRGTLRRSLASIAAALFVATAMCLPAAVAAQDDAEVVKTEAVLAPPDGASNPAAAGKAKTHYLDNGQKVQQRLMVKAQHLARRTDYRVVVDGVDLGVFRPKGNSGTLNVKFRSPAKGNQAELPAALADVRAFQTIDVFDAATGELLLTGAFVLVPED